MLKDNLKTLRKNKGLSQEELSIKLHVVRQTISKWESGLSVPDAEMLMTISEIFETPVSEILGESIEEKEKGDIKKLDYVNELKPISLEIAEIGENNEGSLVKISGEVTEIKSSYLYIDDGTDEVQVYFKAGANISKQELNVGDLLEVVGLVHQTKSGFQILPRSQSDIVKTGVIESDALKNQNIESSGGVAEKYLTATAGGLTSILFGLFIRNKRTHILAGLKKMSGVGLTFIRRKTK